MNNNSTLLITGGTGSFGNAVLNRLISTGISEIRIFSRDEKKQEDMRRKYKNEKIKFYIGDVRDKQSVINAVRGVDYIFHAAALKQVPSCEFYPFEAVMTNIIGTEIILDAAISCKVKRVVCLSTDKAVYPINAMGISKAMMEKIAVAKSRTSKETIINITRYGNVMASRGSVIPLFIDQIINEKSISVNDLKMTRFMMTLDDALDLVLFAFANGKPGEIFVQKAPAVSLEILIKSLTNIMGKPNHKIEIIGTRHGEKLYESLLSREEMSAAVDLKNYYKISPDLRDLNYEKYYDKGDLKISKLNDYNSHNTLQLDTILMNKLLLKLPYIQSIINKKY